MKGFEYRSNETLRRYAGKEVKWLDLSGKVRSAVLQLSGKRTYLPESGEVWADTVQVKLPSNRKPK